MKRVAIEAERRGWQCYHSAERGKMSLNEHFVSSRGHSGINDLRLELVRRSNLRLVLVRQTGVRGFEGVRG